MKCRICGKTTENKNLCDKCKEDIDILSAQFTSYKRKINLDFDKTYIYSD